MVLCRVHLLQLDVTKDEDVKAAVHVVSQHVGQDGRGLAHMSYIGGLHRLAIPAMITCIL